MFQYTSITGVVSKRSLLHQIILDALQAPTEERGKRFMLVMINWPRRAFGLGNVSDMSGETDSRAVAVLQHSLMFHPNCFH